MNLHLKLHKFEIFVQSQKIVYTIQFLLLSKVLYHFRILKSCTFMRAIKHFANSSHS